MGMVRPAGSLGYRPMEWYTGGGPVCLAVFRQGETQPRLMLVGWRVQTTVTALFLGL